MKQNFEVGQKVAITKIVTAELIDNFANLSGDKNPIHMSDLEAERAGFSKRVAHGMIGASFVSTIIGMELPGTGALWLDQVFSFQKPIRVGDELIISAEILNINKSKQVIKLGVEITNQDDAVVLSGEGNISYAGVGALSEEKNSVGEQKNTYSAIVLGGTGSVGSALCRELAKLEYEIFFQYYSNSARAENLALELLALGAKSVNYLKADLSSNTDITKLIEFFKKSGTNWTTFIHAASDRIKEKSVVELQYHDILAEIENQLKPLSEISKYLIPSMKNLRFGRIIYVSSVEAIAKSTPGWATYGMAKSISQAYCEYLANEVGKQGITVNCILPHLMDTPFTDKMSQMHKKVTASRNSTGQLCEVFDVVQEIMHHISVEAERLNGRLIEVGG